MQGPESVKLESQITEKFHKFKRKNSRSTITVTQQFKKSRKVINRMTVKSSDEASLCKRAILGLLHC